MADRVDIIAHLATLPSSAEAEAEVGLPSLLAPSLGDTASPCGSGHNYTGQNYTGQNYTGHDHTGHNFMGQNYICPCGSGHNYTGQTYIGHDYMGHNYIGHNYIGACGSGHNYVRHNCIGLDYMGHNYMGHNCIRCVRIGLEVFDLDINDVFPHETLHRAPVLALHGHATLLLEHGVHRRLLLSATATTAAPYRVVGCDSVYSGAPRVGEATGAESAGERAALWTELMADGASPLQLLSVTSGDDGDLTGRP